MLLNPTFFTAIFSPYYKGWKMDFSLTFSSLSKISRTKHSIKVEVSSNIFYQKGRDFQ
jgi:hypothetical protein